MNILIFIATGVVLLLILVIMSKRSSKGVTMVNVTNVNDLLNNNETLILDVRTDQEYKTGHLKNSRNISVQILSTKISSIQEWKDKNVLVYCHSGARSLAASQILKSNGFTKIHNMQGGISAWLAAGNKVIK